MGSYHLFIVSFPSGVPKTHEVPVKAISNTSATIQWKEANCSVMNGINRGFYIELWRDNVTDKNITIPVGVFSAHFDDLRPETQYVARVHAVNVIGFSKDHYSSITFKTKSAVPDPPQHLQVKNPTNHSISVTWEHPLLLNSNPRYFTVTLEQIDELDSQEKPTDPSQTNVPIKEDLRFYELEFDHLNPATTYLVTVCAGFRGQRAVLRANTTPKDPPAPPPPVLIDATKLTVYGVTAKAVPGLTSDALNLLSGYLLLVSSPNYKNWKHGIEDKNLASKLEDQFAEGFYVAQEFPPTLEEEVFTFSEEPPMTGNFSLVQNKSFKPGDEYNVALAAVSSYCGTHAVTVSSVVSFRI